MSGIRVRGAAAALWASVVLVSTAVGEPISWRDDCDEPSDWQVICAEGVTAKLSPTEGTRGPGLRLDYHFEHGTGYVCLRRPIDLPLPENYRFSFDLRGTGPANNLEFKLIDPSGDNVWWLNKRNFEFPESWTPMTYRRRHMQFAWGPAGDKPLTQISAFEITVASSNGGQGTLFVDQVDYRSLPVVRPPDHPPVVAASSSDAGVSLPAALPADGRVGWRPKADDASPWLALQMGGSVELGGVALAWEQAAPAEYAVELSEDGVNWFTAATIRGSDGGPDWIQTPGGEAAAVRVRLSKPAAGVTLAAIRTLEPAFGDSANAMLARIAREAPRGRWPRYALGEQPYWTVVGVANDRREALLDSDGALEIAKGALRVEPFLRIDGKLVTWADVESAASLLDDYLPIPSVTWRRGPLTLTVTVFADGEPGRSSVVARYEVANSGSTPLTAELLLALRPLQVLPPWQELNLVGGVGRIRSIEVQPQALVADTTRVVQFWSAPAAIGATTFDSGEAVEHLARGAMPAEKRVLDARGLASAAARFELTLAAGEGRAVFLEAPLHADEHPAGNWSPPADAAAAYSSRLAAIADFWRQEANLVQIELPPSGKDWVDTARSTLAYLLINADGHATQPGSRTYERSWIRDGAMTSAALLALGETQRVRNYLEWYAPYQYDSGMVPCVVDHRGPDPVPEHDSTGQFIYLAAEYYRYTGDRSALELAWPHVVRGVDYIEKLRSERIGPAYQSGDAEQRAKYGLVTESISHEGYSAKPMHSYWDNFWLLRGVRDAAEIAGVLGHVAEQERFERLLTDYRTAVRASIELAMQNKGVAYVPGCAELGDFDATSTAIVYFPTGEAPHLPRAALDATFDKYWEFFVQRRDGDAWREYTPYELRLIGAFVRRGEPERAHALADWFFGHQRPNAWNHWAEVVWREPSAPRFIGDMPHTWVGSAYITAFRSMFVYESGPGELTLAAGPRPEWLRDGGLRVSLPTHFGRVAFALRDEGGRRVLTLQQADPRIRRIVWATPAGDDSGERAWAFEDPTGWTTSGGAVVRPGEPAVKVER